MRATHAAHGHARELVAPPWWQWRGFNKYATGPSVYCVPTNFLMGQDAKTYLYSITIMSGTLL